METIQIDSGEPVLVVVPEHVTLNEEASGIDITFSYQDASIQQQFQPAMKYVRSYWQQFIDNRNQPIIISVEGGAGATAVVDARTLNIWTTTGTAASARVRWNDNFAATFDRGPFTRFQTAIHEVGHILGQVNTLAPTQSRDEGDNADAVGPFTQQVWSAQWSHQWWRVMP